MPSMNYARTARIYWWLESLSFGPWLRRARVLHLDRIEHVEHALLLGEGNGSFLLPFVRRFPQARVTVVDESHEMLDCARGRLLQAGVSVDRVAFVHADVIAQTWPDQTYDLVVSLFFFDNFHQADVDGMIRSIAPATRAEARWLLADFQIPERGGRRWRGRVWMWVIYRFFGCVASVPTRVLPDLKGALSGAGFESVCHGVLCGGLLYSALYRKGAAKYNRSVPVE